jgi:hypothetical protein
MGFLSCPSPTDNVCDVPHRRALRLNSIISHTNRFTDTRYATIGVIQYLQIIRQPRSLSPLPCIEQVAPLRHTRQGLRRFARELSCSVDSTVRRAAHRSRGAAPRRNAIVAAFNGRSYHKTRPHRNLVGSITTHEAKCLYEP